MHVRLRPTNPMRTNCGVDDHSLSFVDCCLSRHQSVVDDVYILTIWPPRQLFCNVDVSSIINRGYLIKVLIEWLSTLLKSNPLLLDIFVSILPLLESLFKDLESGETDADGRPTIIVPKPPTSAELTTSIPPSTATSNNSSLHHHHMLQSSK